MKKDILLYDTTLRDGEQAEGINFSVEDKIRVAHKLDEMGFDYIEGGWPGSNPRAIEFFQRMKKIKLKHARLAAFGSTCRKNAKPDDDHNIQMLLESRVPVVTIFAKSWDLHVKEALRATEDENLRMISESVRYLKSKRKEVVYDAEHWFDGFKNNAEFALRTLQAAAEAGADCIVLCDTNGGTMPTEIPPIIEAVKRVVDLPLGIHAHNDAGAAVANSLIAIDCGCVHVQGTINGYGERTGNADLIQIIPNLELKYNKRCLPPGKLAGLTALSHFIAETTNLIPDQRQPYVGRSTFAHKGGIHVSAVRRHKATYEHVTPELVGNKTRVLVSDQSGQSNLRSKAEEMGIDISNAPEETKQVLARIKRLENEGYEFEGAEGSIEILMKKALKKYKSFFELESFRVIVEKRGANEKCVTEATVKVRIDDEPVYVVAEGDGPVNALDQALRRALRWKYPAVKDLALTDFKVRIIDPKSATAAKTRVLIESSDGQNEWGTVGVSENIIEAAWRALVDSVEFKLLRDEEAAAARKKKRAKKAPKTTTKKTARRKTATQRSSSNKN